MHEWSRYLRYPQSVYITNPRDLWALLPLKTTGIAMICILSDGPEMRTSTDPHKYCRIIPEAIITGSSTPFETGRDSKTSFESDLLRVGKDIQKGSRRFFKWFKTIKMELSYPRRRVVRSHVRPHYPALHPHPRPRHRCHHRLVHP